MRNFITIILTSSFFCKGQSLNLVPVDSANFEIIADSLVDKYSILPDSIKFSLEAYKICPCVINDVKGLISYKSSSFSIKNNKCLFLYKTDSEYFIRVGQMTNVKDKSGKYIFEFSAKKSKNEIAEQYINKTKKEIDNAEVPRFREFVTVTDGVNHTFGDIENRKYATTPITYFSDSVNELIRLSEKLIKKNR